MTPNPCAILAIDPGKSSGAAFFLSGELRWHRRVDVSESGAVAHSTNDALRNALSRRQTLVLVGETWGKGGPRGMAQWQGLGAAWKTWEWALDYAWKTQKKVRQIGEPAPKKVRVHVSTWRARVFGGRTGKNMAKKLAVETARTRFGVDLLPHEHDVAEAIMVGYWALYAPEVLAVVPKRFRGVG